MKKIKLLVIAAAVIPFSMAIAGPMKGHPNLEKAEADLTNAWEHITASQQANEFDAGGHAAKAKDLIGAAKDEVHKAAVSENKNK
jgi:hypothetical protein|nr:hypothetical protein [Kofleriaceae bacterium]